MHVLDAMARSPHDFQHMRSLEVEGIKRGEESVNALFSALQAGACPSLQQLSLVATRMGDVGLMSFAAALEDGMVSWSNSLKVINLQR